MNDSQLKLYHHNLCTLAIGLQNVGGHAGHILSSQQFLLEHLARNGVQLSIKVIDIGKINE